MSVKMFVLAVVRRRDLRQQARHHLDDIRNRHRADLILLPDLEAGNPSVFSMSRMRQELFTRKAMDMIDISDLDPTRRVDRRPGE